MQTKPLLDRMGIQKMQVWESKRNRKGRVRISDSALMTMRISAAPKKLLHLGEK